MGAAGVRGTRLKNLVLYRNNGAHVTPTALGWKLALCGATTSAAAVHALYSRSPRPAGIACF